MRKTVRKDMYDWQEGMDSNSGLLSLAQGDAMAYLDSWLKRKLPLLKNGRILDKGRFRRRNGYKKSGSIQSTASQNVISAHFLDDPALAPYYASNGALFWKGHDEGDSAANYLYWTRPTGASPANIEDYGGTNSICLVDDGAVFSTNDQNAKTYWPGYDPFSQDSASLGIVAGAIIDTTSDGTQFKARKWGIEGPLVTPTIFNDTNTPTIPAAAAGGWWYFYTYINKRAPATLAPGTELFAESTPSPMDTSAFAPVSAGIHQVAVVASDDPQVTGIRVYRTWDGGEPTNAHFLADMANTTGTFTDNYLDADIGTTETIDTFDSYPMNSPNSPKPARGTIAFYYKDRIWLGGTDNYLYYTGLGNSVPIEPKLRTLFPFLNYFDFNAPITSIFMSGNDLIVCTAETTWKIVDGDIDGNKTLVMRLIEHDNGVLSHASVAHDPYSDKIYALTSKGVKAFDGNGWGPDLSYSIRDDIRAATLPSMAVISGVIANRQYYLSVPDAVESRIYVGYITDQGTLAWTKDTMGINAYPIGGMFFYTTSGIYNATAFALMDISGDNYVVKFEYPTNYDIETYKIAMSMQLPRLFHETSVNHFRLRRVRLNIAMTSYNPADFPLTCTIISDSNQGTSTEDPVIYVKE